jgi:hypothetical protein
MSAATIVFGRVGHRLPAKFFSNVRCCAPRGSPHSSRATVKVAGVEVFRRPGGQDNLESILKGVPVKTQLYGMQWRPQGRPLKSRPTDAKGGR